MTTQTLHEPLPSMLDPRTGERWQILSVATTSDGFRLASAVLVDEDGDEITDEGGFAILKSLFLGRGA